jgi:hypothetical protein
MLPHPLTTLLAVSASLLVLATGDVDNGQAYSGSSVRTSVRSNAHSRVTGTERRRRRPLQFRPDGRFKVVQFTDLHLNTRADTAATQRVMSTVLAAEAPVDLVVVSGDTACDNLSCYDSSVEPMRRASVPWAFLNGNHDTKGRSWQLGYDSRMEGSLTGSFNGVNSTYLLRVFDHHVEVPEVVEESEARVGMEEIAEAEAEAEAEADDHAEDVGGSALFTGFFAGLWGGSSGDGNAVSGTRGHADACAAGDETGSNACRRGFKRRRRNRRRAGRRETGFLPAPRALARLWFFDSGDYDCLDRVGYGCVDSKQIEWFRRTADRTWRAGEENGNDIDRASGENTDTEGDMDAPKPPQAPQPPLGLAFVHIPLPELAAMAATRPTVGHNLDPGGIGCSSVNTGLYAAMRQSRAAHAIFSGHDHLNDFWGHVDDSPRSPVLGYGRRTGTSGTPAQARAQRDIGGPGARVFLLSSNGQVGELAPIASSGGVALRTWVRLGDGTAPPEPVNAAPERRGADQPSQCSTYIVGTQGGAKEGVGGGIRVGGSNGEGSSSEDGNRGRIGDESEDSAAKTAFRENERESDAATPPPPVPSPPPAQATGSSSKSVRSVGILSANGAVFSNLPTLKRRRSVNIPP